MLYLYVFATVAGCLLVLVSLFGGGSHESDGDGHGESHADGEAHGATAAHVDVAAIGSDGHAGAADGHVAHAGAAGPSDSHHHSDGMDSGVPTALLWLLSVQLWTYLLAFGGLTGLLLRTVAKVPEPLAGLSALGVGLSTALVARTVMRKMSVTTVPGTLAEEQLVGSSARVLIPAPAGGLGKIRLEFRGQTIDLIAKATDGGALIEGGAVTIVDVRDGQADVSVLRDGHQQLESSRGAHVLAHTTKERGSGT